MDKYCPVRSVYLNYTFERKESSKDGITRR